MKLDVFISQALTDICSGIATAKKNVSNGAICPPSIITSGGGIIEQNQLEQINFEICVTVDNTEGVSNNTGGKIGILSVLSAEVNKSKEENLTAKNQVINKIAFSIPFLPQAIVADS